VKKPKQVKNNAKQIVEGVPDEDLKELLYIIYDELNARKKFFEITPIDRKATPTILSLIKNITQREVDYVQNELMRNVLGQDSRTIMCSALYLSGDAAKKSGIKKEEWQEYTSKLAKLIWKKEE